MTDQHGRYSEHLVATLQEKLHTEARLPVLYIDSHHSTEDEQEREHFAQETSKLWSLLEARAGNEPSRSFTITENAPTSAFTFKTLC